MIDFDEFYKFKTKLEKFSREKISKEKKLIEDDLENKEKYENKILLAHWEELENNLEEAINLISWFLGEE